MKAITLTFDRRRGILKHMLKTYSVHWPGNPTSGIESQRYLIFPQSLLCWLYAGFPRNRCPESWNDLAFPQLAAHPRIAFPAAKEVHFWDKCRARGSRLVSRDFQCR
jgi:hypothetical protein